MAMVVRRSPRFPGDLARGCGIAFLGDSITNDTGTTSLGPQEWHFWMHALSGGRVIHAGKFGAGGLGVLTTASNGSTWEEALTAVLALSPRPSHCVVLIGGNDLAASNKTVAEVTAALAPSLRRIAAVGIQPVLGTLVPSNSATGGNALETKYHTFNAWASRHARLNGYGYIDFYTTASDDSGAWLNGYNRDSVHPNKTGAKALGQIALDAFLLGFPPRPYLAASNTDTTGVLNPLMLTDAVTNGSTAETANDGIPDGWGKANTMPAGILHTLEDAGSDAKGNWYHQDWNGNTSGGPILKSRKVTVAPGDIVAIGFRCKITAATAGMLTGITVNQYSGTSFSSSSVGSLWIPVNVSSGQAIDLDPATFYRELTVTAQTAVAIGCDVQNSGGDGDFYLGQFTMRNLTALGVA